MDEQPLEGGIANAGEVVRVGPHVVRPSSPHSGSIHAFLVTVRHAGFEGVLMPVGIDEDGRERLMFIEGEVLRSPYPEWSQSRPARTAPTRRRRLRTGPGRQNGVAHFVASSVPSLVIHGERDSYVPFDVAKAASEARPDCEFHAVKDSDHGFDSSEKEDEAITLTVNWLKQSSLMSTPSYTMGELVHEYTRPHEDWWEVDEDPPVIESDPVVGFSGGACQPRS